MLTSTPGAGARSRRLAALLSVLLALPVLGGLLAAPPASAGWRPVQPLTALTGDAATDVDLATNARGDSVGIFVAPTEAGGIGAVQLTRRPAGGRWSTPVVVSAGQVEEAAVGIAGDGRAVVVYTRPNGLGADVVARTVPISGPPAAARIIDTATGTADRPTVAVNAAGRAVAAWRSDDLVRGAVGTVAVFGAPRTLSQTGDGFYGVEASMTPSGRADVLWERDVTSPQRYLVETCTWPATATTCAAPVVISGTDIGNLAEYPDLAVSPSGEAVACFDYRETPSSPQRTMWARRPAGGAWSGVGQLAPGTTTAAEHCQVAVRPDGTAVAAYEDEDGNDFVVSRDGGGFDHVHQLNGAGEVQGTVRFAVGVRHQVVVSYATDGGEARVATIPAGSRELGRPTTVLPRSTSSTFTWGVGLGLDDQGNGYVLGVEARCTDVICGSIGHRAVAALFDAAAPTVTGIGRPASGKVGQKVTLKALGAADRIGPITVSWRFGDGTTAKGATVTKKLTRAGRLAITLTVTDADGRRTVRTSSITVRR